MLYRLAPASLALLLTAACSAVEPGALTVRFSPDQPTTLDDVRLVATVDGAWEDFVLTVSRPGLEPAVFGPSDLELTRRPGGGVAAELEIPARHTSRRQTWSAELRALYGRRWVSELANVTISNTAPVLKVVLEPAEPTTADPIRAVVTALDADDDPVVVTYEWFVDGEPALSTTPTLPADATRRGSVVDVRVTAGDRTADAVTAEAHVGVINAPPSAPGVRLGFGPIAGATLQCAVDAPSQHADAIALTYEVAWWVDDAPYDGPTASRAIPGDTIPAGLTVPGQAWSCAIRAFDDLDHSEPGSASVTLVDGGGPRLFTPCGARGPQGPTEAACHARRDAPWAAAELALDAGIQRWTPPFDGRFRITAAGAAGASRTSEHHGGAGAIVAGTFDLRAGEPIDVLVGQPGQVGHDPRWTGGGGGSFVTRQGRPLLVAGGGGAGGERGPGCDGVTARGANDPVSEDFHWIFECVVREGDFGHGGAFIRGFDGAGGGGFYGTGSAPDRGWAEPGGSRTSGGAGGRNLGSPCSDAAGGFGGGGSGDGPSPDAPECAYSSGAGGGGGHSGGDAGPRGGGGGSFNIGDDPDGADGANDGPGWVRIEVE